jgi:hypothetical protein
VDDTDELKLAAVNNIPGSKTAVDNVDENWISVDHTKKIM